MEKNGLTVTVSLADVDVFQGMLDIIVDILKDERIPQEVKEDFEDKVEKMLKEDMERRMMGVINPEVSELDRYIRDMKRTFYLVKSRFAEDSHYEFMREVQEELDKMGEIV
jgi:hypothetical protein